MEKSSLAPSDIDVSFVVTVYNKAQFITGMVESLRSQGADLRIEYIFIDDGSTDGSIERIENATRNLPQVTIIHQPNAGPAKATNVAIHRARGRYVKLLDGDDRLVAGITSLLYRELERSGADLIVGALGTYRLGAVMLAPRPSLGRITPLNDPLETVIATGLSNTSGSMFRRDTFLAAGGCDETVFVQDFSFFLRMAHRGRFLTTNAVVANVPENPIGRVSGMQGQTLHDHNRALYNLVMSHPNLPAQYQCLAMRRAAGRAWKWALRQRGATLFSKPFLVHAISRMPIARLAPWVLRNACRPFYADTNLRFVGPRV